MKIYKYGEVSKVIPVEVNGEKLQLNVVNDLCFYSKDGYYKVGDFLKIDMENHKIFKV